MDDTFAVTSITSDRAGSAGSSSIVPRRAGPSAWTEWRGARAVTRTRERSGRTVSFTRLRGYRPHFRRMRRKLERSKPAARAACDTFPVVFLRRLAT